ncbi:hypothetical protein X798_03051 [Onchocerca flexuosa]|uniref:Uncharacterized protein n=1 Tax=Onchocerca flexuosa TaxID=387005 RepID=A0A238BYQ6_9BILA|nr:hypothetical protein X798_03051 [Onchocerca flexuosa]
MFRRTRKDGPENKNQKNWGETFISFCITAVQCNTMHLLFALTGSISQKPRSLVFDIFDLGSDIPNGCKQSHFGSLPLIFSAIFEEDERDDFYVHPYSAVIVHPSDRSILGAKRFSRGYAHN